jgi:hypothetical protein
MVLNSELNGVELYFNEKPLQNIIDSLKNSGFRWSGFKKCWWAKQNENTLKTANILSGNETITEQKEQITEKNIHKTVKENKKSLWERVQFIKGTANNSKYDYRYVGSNYTGLSVKETASEIRKQLKGLFPEVKFSVTSDYNSIDVVIKQSPYNYSKLEYNPELTPRDYREYEIEHNKELNAIVKYCNELLSSYNYDDSDSMSDYFNCHFYEHVTIDGDYIQTEQNEEIKADMLNFDTESAAYEKAEEERKEKEYQEQLKKNEEEHKQYLLRVEEEKKQIEVIYNSIEVKELEEQHQYFVVNADFANLNKNCTLAEYQEEVKKGPSWCNGIEPSESQQGSVLYTY